MAEIKTMRALQHQMRTAAGNLQYGFGTGPNGEVLKLGMWKWPDKLPPLPPLLTNATQRQSSDHRHAQRLLDQEPPSLLNALMKCREVIAEAVEVPMDLSREGYSSTALRNRLKREGEQLLTNANAVIRYGSVAAKKLRALRKSLAKEYFDSGNADQYLSTLGLDDLVDEDPPDLAGREAQMAIQTAVFDVEIVRALLPLDGVQKALLKEERELPKQLDDPRVLAAIFRVPRLLLPYHNDELAAIARMSFARSWPMTSSAGLIVEEMLSILQPVAANAVHLVGRLTNPENPFDAFRSITGGLWALQALVEVERPDSQAASVFKDLQIHSRQAQ